MSPTPPARPPRPSILAWVAIACGIATPLSMQVLRWLVSSPDYRPGDDTFFLFMMAAPALAAIGLVFAIIAWVRQRNGVSTAALLINGVWLALFLFGIVNFATTFEGK